MQERLAEAGLLKGKTVAIDATTLEANAAMRSIVRRDTGASYQEFLTGLAQASGIETPTREQGDTTTITQTLAEAVEQLAAVDTATDADVETAPEVVGGKGYHSRGTVLELETNGFRSYLSEPDRGPQAWVDQQDARDAVYANRRRIGGTRGKALLRSRGELVERAFAHVYDTGGMRRTHLRNHDNILKRLLVHAGGFNLGLFMRQIFGVGKPRRLQGALSGAFSVFACLDNWIGDLLRLDMRPMRPLPFLVTTDYFPLTITVTQR